MSRLILVSFPNWLGDSVLATGILASLGRLDPPPVVDVCGNAIALAVTAEHSAIRRRILYERHGAHRRPRAFAALARELGREGYGAHIVLPSTPSAALFARLVAAPLRAGFNGPGRSFFLTHRHRRGRRGTAHLLDEYRAVAALAVPAALPAEPEVHLSAAGQARARELVGQGEYVVLAPGATFGPAKRWPAERFADVGRELAARHRARIVLVGGPGDHPVVSAVARSLAQPPLLAPAPLDLCGETDLPTLAAVLAGALLVTANDSGPMHLARAVGAPTVGIFGSTEPRWTAPRGGQVVIAAEPPGCAPCYRRTCAIAVQCLVRIPVPAVLAAAERAQAEGGGER